MAGARLRRLREAAGLSPEKAGYEIRSSASKISRMENGRVGFKLRDVEDLLALYGAEAGEREEVLTLAGRANASAWWAGWRDVVPGWFEIYLGMEADASVIRSFESQFVHGLFQTGAYARAVVMLSHKAVGEEEVDRRVGLRLARQKLLERPDPPRIWVVVDEAVLRRPVGGREVMRGQLERLVEVAHLPRVTAQVMPFTRGGHAAAGGAFTVLRFEEPDVPDTVYIEQLSGAVYLEERADVEHHTQVMTALHSQALNPAASLRFLRQIIKET